MQFLVGREESKVAIICKGEAKLRCVLCGSWKAEPVSRAMRGPKVSLSLSLSLPPSKGPLLRVKPLQHARVHARAPATIYIRSWPDKKGRRDLPARIRTRAPVNVGQTSR